VSGCTHCCCQERRKVCNLF